MTKAELTHFNGRSIRFSIGSLIFQGAVHHDSWAQAFRIIYAVEEEGHTWNENLPLYTALIENIKFDEHANMLTLL